MSTRKAGFNKYLQVFLTFFFLVLGWQVIVALLKIPDWILPSPADVIATLIKTWGIAISKNAIVTTKIILGGFGIAVIVGIPLGLAITSSEVFTRSAYPVIVFFQLIPKIALGPLFVIWMGFDYKPRLLLTFLMCFFPIVVNSIVGFASISEDVRRLSLSMGSKGFSSFIKIKLPSALPTIFAGLKLSAISATIGAIVAEFIGASDGLGYLLLVAKGDLDTKLFFAVLIVLVLIGLAFFFTIELVERITIPWHISKRGVGEKLA